MLRDAGIKVFQIETTVNNDLYGDGPLSVLAKREWEWTTRDRATFMAAKAGLDRLSPANRRRILHGWRAPYAMTSVQAGEVEAVHKLTTAAVYDQQLVPVEGQTDVLALGLPYVCPYNVNSIMNPILVMCLGLGYFFNLYKGRPLVREGGVLIMSHPTTPDFHPVHHPSLHRLLRGGPGRHHRPDRDGAALRAQASPRTTGTATCTGPATPTTACTRSTCGTGAATPWSTSVA